MFLKLFFFLIRAHAVAACSYKLISSGTTVGERTNFVASEYCSLPLTDVDVSSFVPNRYTTKQYCGTFINSWSKVNSSIIIAPLGHLGSWVVTSSRVMRDCTKIPTKHSFISSSDNCHSGSDCENRRQMKVMALCWQSCSYRWGGTFQTLEPPSTFEFLFTPFKGQSVARHLMSVKSASTGYAEFSSTLMLLLAVDHDKVESILESTTPGIEAVIFSLAHNTLLLATFLEMSSVFYTDFLFKHTFFSSGGQLKVATDWEEGCDITGSSGSCAYVNFWEKLGGCITDAGETCPMLACGDTITSSTEIVSAYQTSSLISGTVDGDDVECASPYIHGLMTGLNTTETGEDHMSEALSIQLVKSMPMRSWQTPAVIGAFEDLIGSVCPHSWFDIHNDADDWATLIDGLDEQAVIPGETWRSLSWQDRCDRPEFDAMANRYLLPSSAAWQYGQAIMYMPSNLESYAFAFFLKYSAEYVSMGGTGGGSWSSDIYQNRLNALLLMKLRFRDHEAENHAIESVNSINSKPLVAGACDGNLDDYNLFTTEHVAGTMPPVGDNEDPCVYMNLLLMLSEQCEQFMNNADSRAQKGACNEAIKLVLSKLQVVCDGTCSPTIMDDYFCTQVSQLTQAVCENTYVISYYTSMDMSTCSDWYIAYMPEMCSDMNLDTVMNFDGLVDDWGLPGLSGNYYGAGTSNCGRRLEHYGNGQGGGSQLTCSATCTNGRRLSSAEELSHFKDTSSLQGRQLKHDTLAITCRRLSSAEELSHFKDTSSLQVRRLEHTESLSFFKDVDAVDNLSPVIDYALLDGSVTQLIDFGDFGDISESATIDYESSASTMLAATSWALRKNNVDRVSLLSEVLVDLAKDGSKDILEFFGEFLHKTAQLWDNQYSGSDLKYVPMFALCDVEFEESLTRDNIELKSMYGEQDDGRRLGHGEGDYGGACPLGPSIISSTAARKRAQAGFAKGTSRFWF